ncbi:hypothetical protein SVIOM342S_01746 [Streptomyces violaceorubidus]
MHDAVVVARPDGGGDRRVVAYLIAEPGTARPSVSELRAHAARTLPDYMVPNFVAFLPSFPRRTTASWTGTLQWPLPDGPSESDRQSMSGEPEPPAPARRPATGTGTPFPSAGELAEEIGALLADLIGVPELDATLDLWDQGATSFTLAQLSSALRSRYGRRVPVSALLAEPTVAGMARHLAGGDPATAPAESAESAEPAGGRSGPRRTVPGAGLRGVLLAEDRDRFKSGAWHLRQRSDDEPLLVLDGPLPPADRYRERATHRDFAGTRRLPPLPGRPAPAQRPAATAHAACTPPRATPTPCRPICTSSRAPSRASRAASTTTAPTTTSCNASAPAPASTAPSTSPTTGPSSTARRSRSTWSPNRAASLYGEESQLYLAVEAGYMGQLLMSGQRESGVGLCAIRSSPSTASVTPCGESGQRLLHAFLAGPLPRESTKRRMSGRSASCGPPARDRPHRRPRRTWP